MSPVWVPRYGHLEQMLVKELQGLRCFHLHGQELCTHVSEELGELLPWGRSWPDLWWCQGVRSRPMPSFLGRWSLRVTLNQWYSEAFVTRFEVLWVINLMSVPNSDFTNDFGKWKKLIDPIEELSVRSIVMYWNALYAACNQCSGLYKHISKGFAALCMLTFQGSVVLPKLETALSSLKEQVKQVDKMLTFPQGWTSSVVPFSMLTQLVLSL